MFDKSVDNLHGPILSPSAIADDDEDVCIAGDSDRTKVCHFVRARLLSTFNFLSLRSNQDDTCVLLTRCFEQMASLTMNGQSQWIKPVYTTTDDELTAEQEYQKQVFYAMNTKLAEHKAYINQLLLQSQIQISLQDFITQMPINIQFLHFKTELHNPTHAHLPLKILRRVMDSMGFLKMTKCIYDLSQFYLLLHQTYTQLIERDEFITITLQELYDRAQNHFNSSQHQQYENETSNHLNIIENGIRAVNDYYHYSGGLIRPGACDETQRFVMVTWETPVNYLATTENHDEGDIVMRVLRYVSCITFMIATPLNAFLIFSVV